MSFKDFLTSAVLARAPTLLQIQFNLTLDQVEFQYPDRFYRLSDPLETRGIAPDLLPNIAFDCLDEALGAFQTSGIITPSDYELEQYFILGTTTHGPMWFDDPNELAFSGFDVPQPHTHELYTPIATPTHDEESASAQARRVAARKQRAFDPMSRPTSPTSSSARTKKDLVKGRTAFTVKGRRTKKAQAQAPTKDPEYKPSVRVLRPLKEVIGTREEREQRAANVLKELDDNPMVGVNPRARAWIKMALEKF
ncbi:hypothetical protein C8F01DRAFT_1242997 [Mycena amicta]|nr:hypothetical protein C8F01DRAFT_1242997 [Mycena amicta]